MSLFFYYFSKFSGRHNFGKMSWVIHIKHDNLHILKDENHRPALWDQHAEHAVHGHGSLRRLDDLRCFDAVPSRHARSRLCRGRFLQLNGVLVVELHCMFEICEIIAPLHRSKVKISAEMHRTREFFFGRTRLKGRLSMFSRFLRNSCYFYNIRPNLY